MANTVIGPAIPDILEHFGQPDSATGWLVAAGPAPAVLTAPFIGVLADRFGRRAVLVPALVLFGTGALIAATAGSFGVLLVGRVVQGIGSGAPVGMVITIIGDHWEGETRGRYIAYNAAVLTIAIAVLPPLGGGLAALGGWRWSFAPQMAAFVVATLLVVRLPRGSQDRSASVREQLAGVRRVLALPGVVNTMVMGFVTFVLIFGLFVALFPVYLENEFGLDVGLRGLMLVAPAVASTTGSLLLPRLRARQTMRQLLVRSTVIAVIGYVLVGATPWLGLVMVASLAYGWFEGVQIPMLQDAVVGAAPDAQRGSVVSVWIATIRSAQAVGPLAAGAALGVMNERAVFLIGAVALVGLVIFSAVCRLPDPTGDHQ